MQPREENRCKGLVTWKKPTVHSAYFTNNKKSPLGYERVYLKLCEVADTPFYSQGDDILSFDFVYFPSKQILPFGFCREG